MASIIKRHSLLRRNPELSREAFFDHYLNVHGPLASAQAGFRQFAYRYVQNHIDAELTHGDAPQLDGITTTFQVPRADYRLGFFQHPDYANVQPDEMRLFDLSATISVLGNEDTVVDRADGGEKAIVILARGGSDMRADANAIAAWRGIRRAVLNRLDTGSASALGFGKASFSFDQLWEIWFDTAADCLAASGNRNFHQALAPGEEAGPPIALAVREFTIFSGPRPTEDGAAS
jgi:hypothetical protein